MGLGLWIQHVKGVEGLESWGCRLEDLRRASAEELGSWAPRTAHCCTFQKILQQDFQGPNILIGLDSRLRVEAVELQDVRG